MPVTTALGGAVMEELLVSADWLFSSCTYFLQPRAAVAPLAFNRQQLSLSDLLPTWAELSWQLRTHCLAGKNSAQKLKPWVKAPT